MSRRRRPEEPPALDLAVTQELVEELLRTAVALDERIGVLLGDLPAEAFPDEDAGEALLEMIIGSVHPAARAAGRRDCRMATALVGAIRERVLDDLDAAATLIEGPGDEPEITSEKS
jgi:F420-0:gamma-glutamyl ligase